MQRQCSVGMYIQSCECRGETMTEKQSRAQRNLCLENLYNFFFASHKHSQNPITQLHFAVVKNLSAKCNVYLIKIVISHDVPCSQ